MGTNQIRRYFFLGLLLIGIIVAVLMLWPFAKVIITSIALSAIFHPLYKWFLKKVTPIEWLAALLTVLCFIIILCLPLFFIGAIVIEQAQYIYSWIVDQGGLNSLIASVGGKFEAFMPNGTADVQNGIQDIAGKVTSTIGHMFTATISTIFSLLLIILSMFYFLKDGSRWKSTLTKLSPLNDTSDEKIISKLKVAVNGIVKGYLLIAIIQGLLMGIGLQIFGVPNAALWGVMAGIASLVPTIGTALIAVPAIAFLFLTGNQGGAIGLTLWAAIIVGAIDNLLNPIIVGRTIDIHPLLILFTVLGGIALMGPLGILIGPLVISFIYTLVSLYKSEMA